MGHRPDRGRGRWLIVDYDDAAAMRRAILWIVDNPEEARVIGERARSKAAAFPSRIAMEKVYELATRGCL